MTDIKLLEKKIRELEDRLKKVEDKLFRSDALYERARELVIKNNKASIIFLQRKLMIDLERSSELLERLEENGVIGPETGVEPRKILVKNTKKTD